MCRGPVIPAEAGIWELDAFAPLLGTEEGQALARLAPGWCDHRLQKAPTTRFVLKILERGTKHLNDGSRNFPETTPVPLRGTSPPETRGALKTSNLEIPAEAGMRLFTMGYKMPAFAEMVQKSVGFTE